MLISGGARGVSLVLLVVGCTRTVERGLPNTEVQEQAVPPAPVDDTRGVATLSGQVTTLPRSGSSNAIVEACGLTATTDAQGWFRIQGEALIGCKTVKARRPGQVATSHPIHLRDNLHGTAHLVLPPPSTSRRIAATEPVVLGKPGEAQITLPGGGFRTAAGQSWDGDVEVRWVWLKGPEHIASAPGAMKTATGSLESFGMVGVELATPEGDPLKFAGTAEVRFPLSATAPFKPGDQAPLYHFADDGGPWTLAGTGRISEAREFVAQVDSFSWWNCDQPAETRGCVTGRLAVEIDDADLQGALVQGISEELAVFQSTRATSDGSFCLDLPEGPARISATLVRDDLAYRWSQTVVVPGSGGTCGVDECAVDLRDMTPSSEQTMCIRGEALQPGCLTFTVEIPEKRGEPTFQLVELQVEPGPFRATVPWGTRIHLFERTIETRNHGVGAMQPAGLDPGSCYDLGEQDIEFHHSGWTSTDLQPGCW